MNYPSKNYFFIVFFALLPFTVGATEIRLDAHKSEINPGEQFLVDIIIHSEESLNAVEGRLVFPWNLLSVKEIRDGNSVINFWVEKPHIETTGVILFSGITPGGFSGANNSIFSIVFEAKSTGIAPVTLEGTKALLNDGLGTETVFLTHNIAISIKLGDSNVWKEISMDTEPPEDFLPIITENPTLFEGKRFLVFATQDKISGIEHYEVREGAWGRFTVAESPYLLKYQSLDRKIFVKAVDKVGNERVAMLNAQRQAPWYRHYTILGILLVMVIFGFLLKKLWPRFIH